MQGSELSSEDGDVPAVLPVSDEEGGSEGTEEMSVAESDTVSLAGPDFISVADLAPPPAELTPPPPADPTRD